MLLSRKTRLPFAVGIVIRPCCFFNGNVITGLVKTHVFFAAKYAAFVNGLNVTRTGAGPAGILSNNASSNRSAGFIKYLGCEYPDKVAPAASL